MYETSSASRCCIFTHPLLDDRENLRHDCHTAISRVPRPDLTIPIGLWKRETFRHYPFLKLMRPRTPPSDLVELFVVDDHYGNGLRLSREMRIHQIRIVVPAQHTE